MVIEVILLILGVFTLILGIWNFYIQYYVWGWLFLIGGLWSIWLGSAYIRQILKKKNKKSVKPKTEAPEEVVETVMEVEPGDDEVEIIEEKRVRVQPRKKLSKKARKKLNEKNKRSDNR